MSGDALNALFAGTEREILDGQGHFWRIASIPGGQWGPQPGPGADPGWEAFRRAVYEADCACYPKEYQVHWDQLGVVLRRFPRGFRLWLGDEGRGWRPVGYSGWYPVAPDFLRLLRDYPEDAASVAAVPHEGSGCLYLFNYSVVSALRRSLASASLMKKLAEEVENEHPTALCAATVSEDGVRVARRFGMTEGPIVAKDGKPWRWYATFRQ